MNETVGEMLYPIAEGIRSAPAVADLNGDGYLDLLVGNYAGGLSLFMGALPPPLGITSMQCRRPVLTVWPNPTSGVFTIDFGDLERYKVSVYDLSGRLLFRTETGVSSSVILNLTDFPDSIYIGRCESAKGVRYFKVVKR